jgi:hypothetical protein
MNSAQFGAVLALTVWLAACAHSTGPTQTTFDPPYPERSPEGAPIQAVFEGRIPCLHESCDMRKVQLVLYGSDDGRGLTFYWLGQIAVGLGTDRLVRQGRWAAHKGMQHYPEAVTYVLDANADPSLRNWWRVSVDVVLLLDERMLPKAGNAAWGTMLSRYCGAYGPRTHAYDERKSKFLPASGDSSCAYPAGG